MRSFFFFQIWNVIWPMIYQRAALAIYTQSHGAGTYRLNLEAFEFQLLTSSDGDVGFKTKIQAGWRSAAVARQRCFDQNVRLITSLSMTGTSSPWPLVYQLLSSRSVFPRHADRHIHSRKNRANQSQTTLRFPVKTGWS